MQRYFSGLANLTLGIAGIGIGIAVLLNLAQIVHRYILFAPLSWTEEVMRYILIWVMMLGVGSALYRSEEATAPMLAWVPWPWFQRLLHWLRIVLVFVFSGVLVYFGYRFGLGAGSQVSPSARIPMMWPYFAFFVGGIVIFLMAVGMVFAPAPPSETDEIRPEDAL